MDHQQLQSKLICSRSVFQQIKEDLPFVTQLQSSINTNTEHVKDNLNKLESIKSEIGTKMSYINEDRFFIALCFSLPDSTPPSEPWGNRDKTLGGTLGELLGNPGGTLREP